MLRGGIYLSKYKKKLPVQLIIRDDRSDIDRAIRLFEELITKDKVDMLLPPWGTGMHFAVAPLVTKHGYPIIGPTISSEKIREMAPKLPYFFGILNTPRNQAKSTVGLLKELKIKRVVLIYTSEIHGIEWVGALAPALGLEDIQIDMLKAYPPDVKDLTALLKNVQKADADAILAFSYPRDTFMITKKVKEMGINPKIFFLTVGVAFPVYRDKFGADTVEGVMGAGAWNPKLPYPGAKNYFDRHVKRWNKEPDRWASAFTYASLQIIQTAIEKVGSIDRQKIKDVIATDAFSTVIGPVKFENGFSIYSPGEIGQWQNGEFEVIADRSKRTAKPIFPKPNW